MIEASRIINSSFFVTVIKENVYFTTAGVQGADWKWPVGLRHAWLLPFIWMLLLVFFPSALSLTLSAANHYVK